MNRIQFIFVLAILGSGLSYAAPAYAYLDPGTGSIILQGLIATVAGALVAGRLYWQRVKAFFRGLTSGGKDESQVTPDTHESARSDDEK